VFGEQNNVTDHIPAHRQGLLGALSADDVGRLQAYLAGKLRRS
jgi:hypothetical protein